MSKRPVPWRILLALLFCLTLTVAPSLAEARAGSSWGGGGSSFGSRGARSFESNQASPLSRSATPMPGIGAGGGFGGGGFFSRHPFLTGMFGGFLGASLFGGGFFGHAFGGLFTLLIIGGIVWFLFRLLSGGFSSAGGGMMPRSVGAAAAPAANRFRGHDIGVGDADLSAFQGIHAQVQESWSRGDLAHMRGLMTPEMVGYFNEELTRNASQGVQNLVSNVNLLKGEVTEAWEEGDLQYATAFMRWSALDYVVRLGANGSAEPVVSGNPRTPVEEEEMWTFVRRHGGQWLLSAIQQV
ncbi:MAG TPA: TIM44-like domain-containing protein [Stellaceae bacterium]|nr:TIM44-like domain-containing protein [Stellaceae bacterium]